MIIQCDWECWIGVHTVVFTVITSTLKYNVTVFPESGPVITAENKPMITDNPLYFNNPAHPMLSFLHQGSVPTGTPMLLAQ